MYPPASEASREVVNLTGRKNLHTPVNGKFSLKDICTLVIQWGSSISGLIRCAKNRNQ